VGDEDALSTDVTDEGCEGLERGDLADEALVAMLQRMLGRSADCWIR